MSENTHYVQIPLSQALREVAVLRNLYRWYKPWTWDAQDCAIDRLVSVCECFCGRENFTHMNQPLVWVKRTNLLGGK